MAKAIKFNLICDDKPVRTIEDLQNNFIIEDVLAYYNNGLLKRWLKVRGYTEELKKIEAAKIGTPMETAKTLIKIFNITKDEEEIEQSVYILQYLSEKKNWYNTYKAKENTVRNVIDNYNSGYLKLIKDILDNPNDIAKIKASVAQIMSDYEWIFKMDNRRIYFLLKNISPLAIMCFLMNDKARKYYLPVWLSKESIENYNTNIDDIRYNPGFMSSLTGRQIDTDNYADIEKNDGIFDISIRAAQDKKIIYDNICSMIKNKDFREKMGNTLCAFSGTTDKYWKDLEAKGKKYMIISMGRNDKVRSTGALDEEFDMDDIANNFIILDGINYESNDAHSTLLYMEV